jgi:hypothetical protein
VARVTSMLIYQVAVAATGFGLFSWAGAGLCVHTCYASGAAGKRDGGQPTIPTPAIPDGDAIAPVSFPVGTKFVPSPSPNG